MSVKKILPKEYLKILIEEIVLEHDKLNNSDNYTRNSNYYGSFFVCNGDVENVEKRLNIVKDLKEDLEKKISDFSKEKRASYGTKGKDLVSFLHTQIDSFEKGDSKTILGSFYNEKVKPILNDESKKQSLSKHCFSANTTFNFLSKISQKIKSVLGIKTSSENIIEESSKILCKL